MGQMTNVEYNIVGDTLTIIIDLKRDFGLSKSGKSITVASSNGNIEIKPGTFLGLNVYKKKK